MKKVFSCGGAPEDEIDDVKRILTEAKIPIWESPKSNWGFQTQAFWVQNDEDYSKARSLVSEYQRQRVARVRAKSFKPKQLKNFDKAFYVLIFILVLYGLVLAIGAR